MAMAGLAFSISNKLKKLTKRILKEAAPEVKSNMGNFIIEYTSYNILL